MSAESFLKVLQKISSADHVEGFYSQHFRSDFQLNDQVFHLFMTQRPTFYQVMLFFLFCSPHHMTPSLLTSAIQMLEREPKLFFSFSLDMQAIISLHIAKNSVNMRSSEQALNALTNISQSESKSIQSGLLPAILFLHAQTKRPLCYNISHVKIDSPKLKSMTLYYLAINYMLAHQYGTAELLFITALRISKHFKEIRSAIVSKFILAGFLNHTSYDVLMKHIPSTCPLIKDAQRIWNLDDHNYRYEYNTKFYDFFRDKIKEERIKRIILYYAQTTTRIPYNGLLQACHEKSIDRQLKELTSNGKLVIQMNNKEIEFVAINYQNEINSEIQKVSSILKNFPPL